MHEVPTTLLYSLEGMVDLKWEKLLKLRCEDGSFLSSPSSTAYALMQTKDAKCFDYLSKAIQKFNGGGNYKHLQDCKFYCFSKILLNYFYSILIQFRIRTLLICSSIIGLWTDWSAWEFRATLSLRLKSAWIMFTGICNFTEQMVNFLERMNSVLWILYFCIIYARECEF